MTIDEAVKMLKQFSCIETKTIYSEEEKKELQEALLLVIKESDAYNLGICADNSQDAINSLMEYLKGFGHDLSLNFGEINDSNEPVYLKFKIFDQSFYLDSYNGEYRGVLISCQSENETVIGTYGHFPLRLFEIEKN